MKNTDIEYQLSTDYERLYDILKSGKKVVGFVAYGEFKSALRIFEYSEDYKFFTFDGALYESMISKDGVLRYMERWGIRYLPLPENQTVEPIK